jgi:hypothetical protein
MLCDVPRCREDRPWDYQKIAEYQKWDSITYPSCCVSRRERAGCQIDRTKVDLTEKIASERSHKKADYKHSNPD